MIRALGGALIAWTGLACAQVPSDALTWLRKMHQAAEKLSYSGTFVYQHGASSETLRITRLTDARGGIEKLEALDGMPREVLRDRESVKCYLSDSQTVKVDRRVDRRGFPALLPEQLERLADHYAVSVGGTGRIAGLDAREIVLSPRDEFRYGYRLWADVNSGMLLKAVVFDERGERVEQFAFTQFTQGGVTRDKLKPNRAARKWRVEDAAVTPANLAEEGWGFGAEVLGYRKVAEVTRKLGESRRVGQVVYSDGLAAVSVFIERRRGELDEMQAGLAGTGAVNLYSRELAGHVVTAVGEAPAVSVRRIADIVEYHPAR
jgi:sigma-E factor negative regulatory protein RseB